jgi:formylglycine-generating enzyme
LSREIVSDSVFVSGGTFRMGSDNHYPEEAPSHRVAVEEFWIDRAPVTNRQFRKFANETGYVPFAEIPPDPKDYPGALPHMLKAGSLVFTPPKQPVDLHDWSQWWNFKFGANWPRPYGPRGTISGFDDHPAVHVAYRDAETYAKWAGKELPTEAEWEFAVRGGLDSAEFAWGEDFTPGGKHMANTWQGAFRHKHLCVDGYEWTSPVRAFQQTATASTT